PQAQILKSLQGSLGRFVAAQQHHSGKRTFPGCLTGNAVTALTGSVTLMKKFLPEAVLLPETACQMLQPPLADPRFVLLAPAADIAYALILFFIRQVSQQISQAL